MIQILIPALIGYIAIKSLPKEKKGLNGGFIKPKKQIKSKVTVKYLKNLTDKVLKNIEIRGYYPTVSVSNTTFGKSFYIQNEYGKIRISDHSVSNFDRIMNEIHYSIEDFKLSEKITLKQFEKDILKLFSDNYVNLIFKNGDQNINFHKRVLESDFKNYKKAKIWYQEEQTIPIKLEDLKNYNILEYLDFTKKKDKQYCKILKDKYSFGIVNTKTKKYSRTRFPIMEKFDIEIKLKDKKYKQIYF